MPQPETLEKLQKHPQWLSLTDKQQNFVCAMVEGCHPVEAVKQAYACKTDRSALSMKFKLLRDWKIRQIISFIGDFNIQGALVTQPEAKQLLSNRLRDNQTDATSFVKLFDIYARLNGWDVQKPKHSKHEVLARPDIDSLVLAMEKKQQKEKEHGEENQRGNSEIRKEEQL